MSQPKLLATTVLFTVGCLLGSVVAAKDAAMGRNVSNRQVYHHHAWPRLVIAYPPHRRGCRRAVRQLGEVAILSFPNTQQSGKMKPSPLRTQVQLRICNEFFARVFESVPVF